MEKRFCIAVQIYDDIMIECLLCPDLKPSNMCINVSRETLKHTEMLNIKPKAGFIIKDKDKIDTIKDKYSNPVSARQADVPLVLKDRRGARESLNLRRLTAAGTFRAEKNGSNVKNSIYIVYNKKEIQRNYHIACEYFETEHAEKTSARL